MIEKCVVIPKFPETAAHLNEILRQPTVSVAEVGRWITKDSSIAAHVLKVSNSQLFGFCQTMTSVEQAATVLGLDAVQNIILQTALMQTFRPSGQKERTFYTSLWKHSILTAFLATNLARGMPSTRAQVNPDVAYTCGLLHDFGEISLYNGFKASYLDLLELASRQGQSEWRCEEATFGFHHAEVGALITAKWGMPEAVSEAIEYHHDREAMLSGCIEGWILYYANRIAERVEREEIHMAMLVLPSVTRLLGIGADHYRQIVRRAIEFQATIGVYLV